MLRIGDFARLAQVPVKTLRYYDELGLLAPARIDTSTGYRYYGVEQLPRLNRLLALKDLGFSLEQVAVVLNDGVTLEQLRGMLVLKRAEAGQRSQLEQDRIARIEARLKEIAEEDTMPEFDVAVKNVPAMLVAARRVRIPTNDLVPQVLGGAYDETYAHVAAQGAKPLDPCLALWHTTSETMEDEDAEAVVPVSHTIPDGDNVRIYELPGGTMASAVWSGPFAEFTKLHPMLLRWIDANGYRVDGPSREIYIRLDHAAPETSVTEVQYPIARA